MSGTTVELALKTAVDADDLADYLTISEVANLQTIDNLFSNTTGHNHGGAHQGGPITSIPAGAIPDGSITSVKIADGTIATTDLANSAVTNVKLGPDAARFNMLVNGGFEFWARGAGPFSANGYCSDRWIITKQGTDTLSVSLNNVIANLDTKSNRSAACNFTLGSGAGQTALSQPLKAQDGYVFSGSVIALSIRVKASVASAVRIAIWDQTALLNTFSGFHSGSGNYETLTVVYTVPATTAHIEPTVYFAASGTFYLDNAMLVIGSVPADYAVMAPADDVDRCFRYYEVLGAAAAGSLEVSGYGSASMSPAVTFRQHPKAATPTITKVGTWNVTNCSQPSVAGVDIDSFYLTTTVTALGPYFTWNGTAGNKITAEANP
jgi:hypothetical protein